MDPTAGRTARTASSPTGRWRRAPLSMVFGVVLASCQGAVPSASPAPAAIPVPTTPATPSARPSSEFADVPMYRMDPAHLASQPGPGPDGQPVLVWRTKAGGAARSPILGNGTLFIGSDDGFLYGLDARTGRGPLAPGSRGCRQRSRVRRWGRRRSRSKRGASWRRRRDRY